MRARELGKDPITWSFVKLFGFQLSHELCAFEGLPASHAWRWKTGELWRSRLLTKAQCTGVVVSIVERADRVEFLVDDGTALVKAVLWREGVHAPVSLGDLVHVEGKLNVDRNWDVEKGTRELRVVHIVKVEDPNEELLHWTQVMELSSKYYFAAWDPHTAQAKSNGRGQWEAIAAEAFFSLCITPSRKQLFLARSDRQPQDNILCEMLESFLLQQRSNSANEAISITFSDHIVTVERCAEASEQDGVTSKNQRIRALRFVFRKLRRSGLLFLEDDAADRHVLLSFEAALKPALLQLLQGHVRGLSIAELADAVLSQERYKCIPLQWIETGLENLLMAQIVFQREETQLFYIK